MGGKNQIEVYNESKSGGKNHGKHHVGSPADIATARSISNKGGPMTLLEWGHHHSLDQSATVCLGGFFVGFGGSRQHVMVKETNPNFLGSCDEVLNHQ